MDGEAPVFRISHHLFWTSSQDPGVRLGEMGGERNLSQGMVSATSGLPKSKLFMQQVKEAWPHTT